MTDPPSSIQSITHERLQSLIRVGTRLVAERNLDRLLGMIIEESTAAMEADWGALYLIDRDKQEMWAKTVRGKALFILDNGQVWRQTDGDGYRNKAGSKAWRPSGRGRSPSKPNSRSC